jgi:peroxiredoxin
LQIVPRCGFDMPTPDDQATRRQRLGDRARGLEGQPGRRRWQLCAQDRGRFAQSPALQHADQLQQPGLVLAQRGAAQATYVVAPARTRADYPQQGIERSRAFRRHLRTPKTFAPVRMIAGSVSSASDAGKWKVVSFWPKDFTFICPTEIVDFGRLTQEFTARGAVVYGASTDSEFVHLAWRQSHPDLKALPFPMLADVKRELSQALGVLDQQEGVCLRARPSSSIPTESFASPRPTT